MRAILTYHSIDSSGSVLSVEPEAFRAQVRWLAASPIPVVPSDALSSVPEDSDAIAITFDDGFRNFAEAAWPVLRDHGLPVTVFVVSDRVGGINDWNGAEDPEIPELPLMGWEELSRLVDEGVHVGSHTRTHRRLGRLDAAELVDEIAGSADRIEEETGQRPQEFAYPFGDVDGRALRIVERTYRFGYTTDLGPLGPGASPHRLPRLDMYYFRAPGALEEWGTRKFVSRLWLRRTARKLRSTLTARG